MTISDQTGKTWVTAFNDIALPLLNNRTADELNEAKDNDVRNDQRSNLLSLFGNWC